MGLGFKYAVAILSRLYSYPDYLDGYAQLGAMKAFSVDQGNAASYKAFIDWYSSKYGLRDAVGVTDLGIFQKYTMHLE